MSGSVSAYAPYAQNMRVFAGDEFESGSDDGLPRYRPDAEDEAELQGALKKQRARQESSAKGERHYNNAVRYNPNYKRRKGSRWTARNAVHARQHQAAIARSPPLSSRAPFAPVWPKASGATWSSGSNTRSDLGSSVPSAPHGWVQASGATSDKRRDDSSAVVVPDSPVHDPVVSSAKRKRDEYESGDAGCAGRNMATGVADAHHQHRRDSSVPPFGPSVQQSGISSRSTYYAPRQQSGGRGADRRQYRDRTIARPLGTEREVESAHHRHPHAYSERPSGADGAASAAGSSGRDRRSSHGARGPSWR